MLQYNYKVRKGSATRVKEKVRMICFDMDGTIADLYGVNDWLRKLRSEDPSPYLEAEPMWDMSVLTATLRKLQKAGWKITVITWLSKDSSEPYKEKTREAKLEWLKQYDFPYDYFHGVAYGTTKANCVRKSVYEAILLDDNTKIRDGWHLGNTIDPTKENIIESLSALL
jgi:hypothetical protein